MREHRELTSIGQKAGRIRRHSTSFKMTAVLVLVVFATLVLHGNWLLAVLLIGGGVGIWQLIAMEQLRQKRRRLLQGVESMSDEEFRVYATDLLRTQGYGTLSANQRGDSHRDLHVVYGDESYTCRLVRHSRRLGKSELASILAQMKLYGGRRPMLVTNRTVSLPAIRFAYRVGCLLIDRQALTQLIVQHRQGHRVYTFHREEMPKLRKRR